MELNILKWKNWKISDVDNFTHVLLQNDDQRYLILTI